MSTYVIGDVQGCFDSLMGLLEKIDFDPHKDNLWFAGDLVNRGPKSLEVMRWVLKHDDVVRSVMGNHDMYLLAVALGVTKRRDDTLQKILDAKDRADIINWLRARPFMIEDKDHILVHAGFLPQWSVEEVRHWARALEQTIQTDEGVGKLFPASQLASSAPWSSSLSAEEKLKCAHAAFTLVRGCYRDGAMALDAKGPPQSLPKGVFPWFDLRDHKQDGVPILFGHWAALGLYLTKYAKGLDTGCVWGNTLTALRLEDEEIFRQKALE